jgi:hypothetical protein
MSFIQNLFTSRDNNANADTYVGQEGRLWYEPTTNNIYVSDGTTPGGLPIGGNIQGVHGCFHKMADVTAAAADTVYNFDWFTNVTQHVGDKGVTITAGQPTRLNIDTAGVYAVFVEMQVRSTGNAERDVFLWISKNESNIAETAVKIQIRGGGTVNPVYQLIAKQWILDDIAANDYIELRFALSDYERISLEHTAAQTTPYLRPAVPSAVITVTQI